MFGKLADHGRRLALPTGPGAFRLVLAIIVFLHHFSSLALGSYAVYVFFVLSGYWLHSMWHARYKATRRPYFTYLVSRLWRLAPVMVLVGAITIPLLLLIGQPREEVLAAHPLHLAASTVFLLGYAWLEYAPVGAAWSLDVEMQFYVVAPVLATILAARRRWWVLVAALAVSAIASQAIETPVLPKYIGFFVIGMIAAAADWRPSPRLAFAAILGVGAALALVTLSPWPSVLWGGASPTPLHIAWNLPFNVALALLTVPFAIYTVTRPSDPPDRMFADLSYIVYLLHWVAMQWFFTFDGGFAERLPVAALCFALVPGGSWLIWRFYDRPLNRARGSWVASRTARGADAAPGEALAARASLEPGGP